MIPSVEGSSTFTYILYTKKRLFVKWTNRENMTEITDIFGGLKQKMKMVDKAKIIPKISSMEIPDLLTVFRKLITYRQHFIIQNRVVCDFGKQFICSTANLQCQQSVLPHIDTHCVACEQ